jgi:hypothetical protein
VPAVVPHPFFIFCIGRSGVLHDRLVRAERMEGEDDEDTALLQEMLVEARNYILSFSWCESILDSYFAGGVGKIFAIFLFNISPARTNVDKWMWVVVGDVPPAYRDWAKLK